MVLTSRISAHDPPADEQVEDLFESSLGALFTDDVVNLHGDGEHALAYTSPHLPRPLVLRLSNPSARSEQALFSHHLWNASLLLAELVERDTLGLGGKEEEEKQDQGNGQKDGREHGQGVDFGVRGLSTIEFGAGSGLPSMMGALLGAKNVVVTDYPSPALIDVLKENVRTNVVPEASPLGKAAPARVEGHLWGVFGATTATTQDSENTSNNADSNEKEEEDSPPTYDDAGFALAQKHAFDRVLAADCLWMPWQHENLRRSISWFLKENSEDEDEDNRARAWVVAGLHTKREGMRDFFDDEALARNGLEVETIWERDCDGVEREWAYDRGSEDPVGRKRWLIVGVLRRRALGRKE